MLSTNNKTAEKYRITITCASNNFNPVYCCNYAKYQQTLTLPEVVGCLLSSWGAEGVLKLCSRFGMTSADPFCVRLSERRTAPSCAVSASRRTDGRSSSQPTDPACGKISSRSPRAALSRAQCTQHNASRLLRVRSLL